MADSVHFGPAGNSESFSAMGYRSTKDVPEYLEKMGLDAYEYQCGRGVRISEAGAAALKEGAQQRGILLSLHAPYFISLSSVEEEKREKSVEYILQSAQAARMIGAQKIIIHAGSCSKMTRAKATSLAFATLQKAQQALDEAGYQEIIMCPETMGKINQLGTLEEVLALCKVDERMLPCIDFGHINARTGGAICTEQDYIEILEKIENALGTDRMRRFHSHFSKIEYTTGGEKRHLTFSDTVYGPDFAPLAEALLKKQAVPTIICESAGTQAEDAVQMQQMYHAAVEKQREA